LAPSDRDNLKLIVRGPIPNEQETRRGLLISRQFAGSRDFSNRLGITSEYELEETREQFHKIFRLLPGATVTPWLGFFCLFYWLQKNSGARVSGFQKKSEIFDQLSPFEPL